MPQGSVLLGLADAMSYVTDVVNARLCSRIFKRHS